MAAMMLSEASHIGGSERGSSRSSQERPEDGGRWYFSRKEIEESSPSRTDAIDLKKETYLRKSYCTFLQDLGMRLKVPQITIATAIIFCHRFFIRQSHSKNDRRAIATVCMFLAGKVEETPRPLKDVILVSYEIINKKDPAAAQKIKQKEVYEQQKELILLGERLVLATLGFDLNVHHPYKPLVEAIKKFKVAQHALAQVAWNFVNDGLRTSLCLQFKPHHIAAGAIFLAAKFLKVKLPSDGEKVWWQEFDVTPRQLEEVSNQMLELYEQNKMPPSQGSEIDGSAGGASGHRAPSKAPMNEDHLSKQTWSCSATEYSHGDSRGAQTRTSQHQSVDDGNGEADSVITFHKMEPDTKDNHSAEHVTFKEKAREAPNRSRSAGDDQGRVSGRPDSAEAGEWMDDAGLCKTGSAAGRNMDLKEGPVGQSPKDAVKMIDKEKVRAILEKRRKSRGETTRKKDVMDEDELIERELEDIELPVEGEKVKSERRQSSSKTENRDLSKDNGEVGDGNRAVYRGKPSRGSEVDHTEEGEMIDDFSPMSNNRKRKAGSSPLDRLPEGKKRHDNAPNHNHDLVDNGHMISKDHRRHAQENHSGVKML